MNETTIKEIKLENVNAEQSDENKRVIITKESTNTFAEHVTIAQIKQRIMQKEVQKEHLDADIEKDLALIDEIVAETGLKEVK